MMTRARAVYSHSSWLFFNFWNRSHRPEMHISFEEAARKFCGSIRNSYEKIYFLLIFIVISGFYYVFCLFFYRENLWQFFAFSVPILPIVLGKARRLITFQPPDPLVWMDDRTVVARFRGVLCWRKRTLILPAGAATAVVEIPMRIYRGVPVDSSECGVRLRVGQESLLLVDELSRPEAILVRDAFAAALGRLRPDLATHVVSDQGGGVPLHRNREQSSRKAVELEEKVLIVRSGWHLKSVLAAILCFIVAVCLAYIALEAAHIYGYIFQFTLSLLVGLLSVYLTCAAIEENIRKDILAFDGGGVELRARGVLGWRVKKFDAHDIDELRIALDQGEYAGSDEDNLSPVFHVAFDYAGETFQIGSRLSLQRAVQLRDDIADKLIRARSEA